MTPSPLDAWIARRTGIPGPDPAALRRWQLERLARTVAWARERSPFHAARLEGLRLAPDDLPDALPFTTPDDLRAHAQAMLCTSQGEVERVVTLTTSGSTGRPKRIFLTREDLDAALDFFRQGMATFTGPGDTVLIWLPGRREDGAAMLLAQALEAIGVNAAFTPWPCPADEAARQARREGVTCLAALPSQLASLLAQASPLPPRLNRALTSGEPVGEALRAAAARAGIAVFAHYGLTETGFGGGVECPAHHGYHLREADLLVEVVHPVTGRPQPPGAQGEVAVSTLLRRGMPLLRYRTGDAAALLPGPCPCGSPLARLGPVLGRIRRTGDGFTIETPAKGMVETP